ncbi:bifunctional diguanylate cyclase/phosphodiesterase [Lachnospira sp.]|jgi:diguanylate cyclase (GGDEF)-like protein|uniref:bifunctional diguanylate cyclase/phosphodiesterase n=1 Tax=Lachnospira sp. TaxID=2049031 RepID=UPI002580DB92|nr:bifunctional diguanylate cyclase/phosphodiesterase [Lachnospira sp.]
MDNYNNRCAIMENLIQSSLDAVLVFDEKGRLDLTNDNGKDLLELLDIDPDNCHLTNISSNRHLSGLEDLSESFVKAINLKVNDEERKYNCNYGRVFKEKSYVGCFLIFNDFTCQELLFRKQKYIAEHDEITDFYNKSAFYRYTEELIENHPDIKFDIIYSDIKDFKLINENYGQDVGNEVLLSIAEILKNFPQTNTVIGRLEADHFALCMPDDRLDVDLIKKHSWIQIKKDDYDLVVHNVFGIYQISDKEEIDVPTMCERARMALEHDGLEKKVCFYNEVMKENLIKEQHILKHFAMYIRERKFLVYMQPQYDCKTGNLVGAEALVRLKRKSGISIPYDFVPILEKNGYITEMDYYVWEEACRFLRKCIDNKSEVVPIAVNVSCKDFDKINVNNAFCILTKKYNIPHDLIRLEITESAIASDEKLIRVVKDLRRNGFLVEIDDFGSGYSSLNMLQKISIDVVKLDMNFVKEDSNKESGLIILEGIIKLLKSLRMTVIAEGVETKEQLNLLTRLGCDVIQGYYYSRPIPMDEFYDSLK